MEYVAVFNELSRFAPTQVATKEMKVDQFQQGLRGNNKQMVIGLTSANFQELYQTAVKIDWVIKETTVENKEAHLAKRKFDAGGSSFQRNRNFKNTNTGQSKQRKVTRTMA